VLKVAVSRQRCCPRSLGHHGQIPGAVHAVPDQEEEDVAPMENVDDIVAFDEKLKDLQFFQKKVIIKIVSFR